MFFPSSFTFFLSFFTGLGRGWIRGVGMLVGEDDVAGLCGVVCVCVGMGMCGDVWGCVECEDYFVRSFVRTCVCVRVCFFLSRSRS